MLDANIKTQLKAYLERVTQPIEIVASLDDGPKSKELLELLHDVAEQSKLITLVERRDDPADRRRRIVAATPKGEQQYRTLSAQVLAAEREFFGELPDPERSAFIDTLSTLAHRGRALGAPTRR